MLPARTPTLFRSLKQRGSKEGIELRDCVVGLFRRAALLSGMAGHHTPARDEHAMADNCA
jgi:hypothetical protein